MEKRTGNTRNPKTPVRTAGAGSGFTLLEHNILRAKGVTDAQIETMLQAGVSSKADFAQVGDAETLSEVAGIPPQVAAKVMAWALGVAQTGGGSGGKVVVESSDLVLCVHCGTKQPKDYKSGDLCVACGKQAEPILSCFWCGSSGPGKFCRQCGAEFVPVGELHLGIVLRRDGLPKDQIPAKLRSLTQAEKDELWGRVRRL